MKPQIPQDESAEQNRLFFNARREGTDHTAGLRRAAWIAAKLKNIMPRAIAAEIGCNNGVYTALYAKTPGIEVLEGFEGAEEPLREAQSRGIAARMWRAGIEPCPAADNRYDLLLCLEVIEHIVPTDNFILELKRILKPGGHLLLTTPNLFFWLNRIKMLFGVIPWDYPGVSSAFKSAPGVNPAHIRINSMDEWAAFFKFHGFELAEMGGISWVAPVGVKGQIISWIDKILPNRFQYSSYYLLKKPFA